MNYTPTAHRTTSGPRGWDGKSLREMLLDAERLVKETGHCFGLERIAMKEEEPIRFEKIFSRLRGSLVNARETALNISASPIVKELGELCFALYGPEGDSITLSTGILVHVHTMSEAIKHMIRTNYEENPGINDGDIFINNDPHIGNVHTADVQTFVPIFWEGELIGWAGCVTHVMDIGSSTPGSNAVGPTTRYEDGLTLPCVKCGADDRLFRDHVYRCERAVRTPMYWSLDEKTRLAGCHMIRESVRSLIREEGIGTYKQFIRDVLEDSRRSFIERLRQLLIPGVYEAPAFMDSQFAAETRLPDESRKDTMMHAPMRLTIDPKGRLGVDFEGAGKWGLHSFNCTPSAMAGALWVLLTQTVMPNDKVNDGAHYATDIHCPRGSWVNPDVSTTAHGNAWYYLVPSFGGVIRSLSRAFYARGYVEEVLAFRGNRTVITATETDTLGTIIDTMKRHGVSQVPIVDDSGRVRSLIHEVDILRALQAGSATIASTVKAIAQPVGGLIYPKARIEELYRIFETNQVAIVIDNDKIVGVVSQIDVIEYLTNKGR